MKDVINRISGEPEKFQSEPAGVTCQRCELDAINCRRLAFVWIGGSKCWIVPGDRLGNLLEEIVSGKGTKKKKETEPYASAAIVVD